MNEHDIVDAIIRKRRTVHEYKNTEIPIEEIKHSLELALLAPNHKLTFPWSFVIVGPESRKKLTDIAIGDDSSKTEQTKVKILNPGSLVVFCCKREDQDPHLARENYAAVANGIQNYTLSLMAKGYYSKWSTGKITRSEETYNLLKIDPKENEIVGFIWAGEPSGELSKQRRPELKDVLRILP